MKILLLFFLVCFVQMSALAHTEDSLILDNPPGAEVKVFYFTGENVIAVSEITTVANSEWKPFINKKSSLKPSDKKVTWFKIVINNRDTGTTKLLLVIPAFTRSDLWYSNTNVWIPTYEGGILQGNSEKNIRPEYEEVVPLDVQPGENTYLLRAKFNLLLFNPLIFQVFSQEERLEATLLYDTGGEYDKVFQFAFFIVLLFQLLFIITQSFFIRRIEYLYYITYILFLGFYFLSKGEFLMRVELFYHRFPPFFIYLDHFLSWFSAFIYYRFARSFINLPERDPRLNKQVIIVEYTILCFSLFSFFFSLWSENYVVRENIYVVFSGLMTLATLAIIYRFLRRREVLYNFAIVGSLLITLGSFLSILAYNSGGLHIAGISLHPISIFQLSVVLELLCFTTGLAYKSRLDAREKITSQQELIFRMTENQNLQLKLNTIRDDIARDLHDEVGSTLSSISMYSEAMQNSLTDGEYKKVHDMIGQVGQNSRETMENMKEIIWAINTKNDKLNNLKDRMQAHAASVFSAQGIMFTFISEKEFNSLTLSIDFRKNILLLFKECINNISKHSNAGEVEIRLDIMDNKLRLLIKDNGRGFDTTRVFDGNGLQSMKDRAYEMNGRVVITSSPGTGTCIEFLSGEVFGDLSVDEQHASSGE
jgi:signal transduction histidine kinase